MRCGVGATGNPPQGRARRCGSDGTAGGTSLSHRVCTPPGGRIRSARPATEIDGMWRWRNTEHPLLPPRTAVQRCRVHTPPPLSRLLQAPSARGLRLKQTRLTFTRRRRPGAPLPEGRRLRGGRPLGIRMRQEKVPTSSEPRLSALIVSRVQNGSPYPTRRRLPQRAHPARICSSMGRSPPGKTSPIPLTPENCVA